MCGHADDQSPINVIMADVTEDHSLRDVVFHQAQSSVNVSLVYDRKTWEVDVPEGAASVEFQGKVFQNKQFHFHSPSEHTIDGVSGAMESHFVNQAADGQILVIANVWDIGEESPLLSHLESIAAPHMGDQTDVTIPNPYHYTDSIDQSYYHYTGSLTTPPCTNDTIWVIMRARPSLTPEQLTTFRHHMNDPACNMLAVHDSVYPEGIPHSAWDPSLGVNNRPTQPKGGRAVHLHTYSAHTTELAAGAAEPKEVFLAQEVGTAEQPRILMALSCFSLLSAAMGVVFLRRRVRGQEEEQLLSHFLEISD